jgi:hypothetical protein
VPRATPAMAKPAQPPFCPTRKTTERVVAEMLSLRPSCPNLHRAVNASESIAWSSSIGSMPPESIVAVGRSTELRSCSINTSRSVSTKPASVQSALIEGRVAGDNTCGDQSAATRAQDARNLAPPRSRRSEAASMSSFQGRTTALAQPAVISTRPGQAPRIRSRSIRPRNDTCGRVRRCWPLVMQRCSM